MDCNFKLKSIPTICGPPKKNIYKYIYRFWPPQKNTYWTPSKRKSIFDGKQIFIILNLPQQIFFEPPPKKIIILDQKKKLK